MRLYVNNKPTTVLMYPDSARVDIFFAYFS